MSIVTTGFFDGVHLGHRHVLEAVVSRARERREEAVVVTFWPHPRTVLQQDARDFRLLSSLEEKRSLLLEAGVDRVEVLPFTREFAALTAQEYLQLLKDKFGASLVVMGYDNRIGSDRRTASELVNSAVRPDSPVSPSTKMADLVSVGGKSGSPSTEMADLVSVGGESGSPGTEMACLVSETGTPISSTAIRRELQTGDVEAAAKMLGYAYGLYGVVVAGNRMGRSIGFPTANMQLYEPLKLVPANGVYAVEVEVVRGHFRGMCNIGVRPTVGGQTRTIETHILDFDEDIYGLPLRIRFLRRLRDERKFPSLEALREQLLLDAVACL